jgi:Tol biopolymer transport system component
MVTLATREERVLVKSRHPHAIYAVTWTPDGRRITYAVTPGTPAERLAVREVDVQTAAVADVELVRSAVAAKWSGFSAGLWLPDASGMIITASAERQPQQIWFVPTIGGEPRKITSDVSSYYGISVSRDGTTIAAQRGEVSANIWRVSLDGKGRLEALTTGTGVRHGMGGVASLPDGGALFVSSEDDRPTARIISRDGSRRSQLHDQTFWQPVVSRDGKRVAYVSDASKSFEVWVSDIDGSGARRVTNVGRASNPSFFPDGRRVAYIAPTRKQYAYAASIDGGEPVELTNMPVSSVDVSPDGLSLLCRIRSTDPNAQLWRTATLPIAGPRTPRYFDVPRFGGPPQLRWLPDGSGFTYIDYHDGVANLWLQPLSGAEPRQLTHFEAGRIFSYSLAVNGREAIVSRGNPVEDIVLIRNFR